MDKSKRDSSVIVDTPCAKLDLPREQLFAKVTYCPLCGVTSLKGRQAFQVRQVYWDIGVAECPGCGLLYKQEVPSDVLMRIIYGSTYCHFNDFTSYLKCAEGLSGRARRLGEPPGRHLDYGCGAGSAVWYAQQAGWDSYGCDPFLPSIPTGHPLTGRLFKLDAKSPALLETLGKFDRISLWAVVEHLTDLYQTIECLSRLLKPGGRIIFNCPNGASLVARKSGCFWDMANLVEHVVFMTPRATRWLATHLNMNLEYIRYAGVPYPLGRIVPSFGSQGLPATQFETPSEARRVASAAGKAASGNPGPVFSKELIHPVIEWTKRGKLGGFLGIVTRKAMHISRLGDHIEVGLKVKC